LKYAYIYTSDDKKFERLDKVANLLKDAVFCVNDIESIVYLREKYGIKAMNLDAAVDLFNLLEADDEIYLCTPEDIKLIKASYANTKELCNE